jgi:hypothetical protein
MPRSVSPGTTVYSLNGLAVAPGVAADAVAAGVPALSVALGVSLAPGVPAVAVSVVPGVAAATVGCGVPLDAVAVGVERPTTTGDAPVLSPGGRRISNTATAVPTSITSSAPRYRLNEGSALAGRRQSAQYAALPWSSQYGLAQRLQALIAGWLQE